jgi:aldehyde:ferredoxin oxidoreductase
MRILRVNMTDLTATFQDLPEEWKTLGGRGLTAKILKAEVPPETDALGPDAKLIIATGPLAGTMAPSCGRISVGAKSPLTHGIKEANAGGPTAQKLDKLGIRVVIVEGAPRDGKMHLLHLSKNGASIESAEEYRGMRNYALVEKLHRKFDAKSSIISIGVIGERKLKSAAVDYTDKDGHSSRHAARGGVGAVLGAKGMKAVVVDDSGAPVVQLSDREAFRAVLKDWVQYLPTDPMIKMFSAYGSACSSKMLRDIGSMPVFNYGSDPLDVSPITGQGIDAVNKGRGGKMDACMPGCVVKCSVVYHDAQGKYLTASYEYEATALLGTNLGITDPDAVAEFDRACDEIGIDCIECGAAMGVAASAGKIKMGDVTGVRGLLEEIEKGTEFGNILANGVVSTCNALGVKRIPAFKGQAIPAHDPRVGKGTGVTYATSPMGADHTAGLCYGGDFMNNDGAVERSLGEQIFSAARDALGYCYFATPVDKKKTLEFLKDLVNARYGTGFCIEDLIRLGRETLRDEVEFNKKSGFHTLNEPDPEFVRNEAAAPLGQVFGVKPEEMAKIWDQLDSLKVL